MFFEISSEIGVLQQILTWYCTVAQISFSANRCPSLWQGLIFDFANTFSADNATPSAYFWRKVAQGRTLYTFTVELSTWLSCSLHSCPLSHSSLVHIWYTSDQKEQKHKPDNATPSAYYWRKVAQGRTLYTLTVELSTWLSCSLHSSFVAQMLWHGCGVYIVDQRCEILTNKFESLGFCWLCFRRADE